LGEIVGSDDGAALRADHRDRAARDIDRADLAAEGLRHIALVRIEQLYPFPVEDYQAILARYPNATDVVWCQEEPQNQGAWYQIRHRLQDLAGARVVYYSGRAASAAPATGLSKIHEAEQKRLVETALNAVSIEQTMRNTPRLTMTPTGTVAPIRKSS